MICLYPPELVPDRKFPREKGGVHFNALATQERLTGRFCFTKSFIIVSVFESRTPPDSRLRIVRNTAKKRQVSPRHLSQDRALNRQMRQESAPDRRSSRQKSGVLFKQLALHKREFQPWLLLRSSYQLGSVNQNCYPHVLVGGTQNSNSHRVTSVKARR